MVNPLSSVNSTTAASAAQSESSAQKPLDKDAFLKLLVTQLKNQDPLKPTDGTEFVAQLSQFAMVEQAIAQSSKLEILSTQMTGLSNNEAAGLVGKTVTVRGKGIAFDGANATGASAKLEAQAAKVTVKITDSSGKVVRTLEMGARGAGPMPIKWDGKDDNGNLVAKGSYDIKVEAAAADGSKVAASQDVTGVVSKVTYENGYPELLLEGSGVTAPISDLVSVAK